MKLTKRLAAISREEWSVVVALVGGTMAVEYLLPLGPLPSLLLVLFAALGGVFVVVPGAWATLYRRTGVGRAPWLLAMLLAAAGITLTHWLGDPQPFCEGIAPSRPCLTAYGWAASIYVASTLGIAIGAGHLDRYRRLRRAAAVPATEADDGPVAVEGRIVPLDRSRTGPVSGEDRVWYREVAERPTVFHGYREVDETVDGGAFYVEDGSGRLLVLPDGLDEHDVAEHARDHTEHGEDGRRREWGYPPGEAVTVVGEATDVSRAEYPVRRAVGLEGPVIVAQRTLSDLRTWAAQRAVVGGLLGVFGTMVSLVIMVATM